MGEQPEYDTEAFRIFEESGWNRNAATYADAFGRATVPFIRPLLDAARVDADIRLLDLACGPGDLASEAALRGADVIGADIAEEMIAEARRRNPTLSFHKAPAEDLPFETASFDAVCCGFGMHHFAEPERAAKEVFRVLAQGGSFAFTVWAGDPGRSQLFDIVVGAIQAHGGIDVPLPDGPSTFGLAKHERVSALLKDVGFSGVQVEDITIDLTLEKLEDVLDIVYTTVRTRALVEGQPENTKEVIHRAILDNTLAFSKNGVIQIQMTGVLASAKHPQR